MEYLNQLKDFSNTIKAKKVYSKCIDAGKYKLAEKIKNKYKLVFTSDDAVDALEYSISCLPSKRERLTTQAVLDMRNVLIKQPIPKREFPSIKECLDQLKKRKR